MVALVGVGVVLARPWVDEDALPSFRPAAPPEEVRSISLDFDVVVDDETDWDAVAARLDEVDATTVHLNAGRIEFTAFDWPAYPQYAAEPGTDHLAVAARALHESQDGVARQINLIIDAYTPELIKEDPSLAGIDANGVRSTHVASATQLMRGEVGERIADYAAALGERYDPNAIELTELNLDRFTFGEEDFDLFREMTQEADWPRNEDGTIDTGSPLIGTWRSDVVAGLLSRVRAALDEVREGRGEQIELSADVRVDWTDPAAGRPDSGHDYSTLLEVADRLVVWVYIGPVQRSPDDVESLTAALAEAGYDMSRLTMSVGLWKGRADDPTSIEPGELAGAVRRAATNGITSVNVTPYSMMSAEHWAALAAVWNPPGTS
ncbi:conserved hypothetical protein [Beutenbergia cavernae DSM 12333]|uniref:Glycosyl hydrolase-like 10 domain-containing protein n=1 Tax=Beutenbergia cavernae (strain ATCC BAA-8 / DSM 12333 / CCUG 43141 / JCM 11478 / NBRC 16432 / NCIMB 13614 / HKI 0122) TaxID=471853 RepID=C5BWE6_BEUC1|nr:conserved hypothetical protein [Beutenbergia cavernae DSM 12333]